MRADVIVLPEPAIDDDLGLFGGGELSRVEDLAAQGAVEALVVSILPGRTGVDPNGLHANALKPGPESLSGELRPVVNSQVTRFAVTQDEPVEDLQSIASGHPGANLHRQRLAGVLVEHGQHLVGAAVTQLVVDEADAPNMVGIRRPVPDDGAVVVVVTLALLLAPRLLQPFLIREALHLLVVHPPAFNPQQFGDLAIAMSALALGKADIGQ